MPWAGAVAVVLRVAGGLGQLLDDHVLRRVAGIAHPQVDHVVARAALFVHQLVDLCEQIRRQPANAIRHFNREGLVLDDRFSVLRNVAHELHSGVTWKPIRGRDVVAGGCVSRRIAATND